MNLKNISERYRFRTKLQIKKNGNSHMENVDFEEKNMKHAGFEQNSELKNT